MRDNDDHEQALDVTVIPVATRWRGSIRRSIDLPMAFARSGAALEHCTGGKRSCIRLAAIRVRRQQAMCVRNRPTALAKVIMQIHFRKGRAAPPFATARRVQGDSASRRRAARHSHGVSADAWAATRPVRPLSDWRDWCTRSNAGGHELHDLCAA
jgi:hypothetical protein